MTTLTTLVLELHKNNFTSNYTDYADFKDYLRNNFTTDYADCANIREYKRNNCTTDYTGYADFQDCVRNAFPRVRVQKYTILISKTTLKIIQS